jgi:hypothetical protein
VLPNNAYSLALVFRDARQGATSWYNFVLLASRGVSAVPDEPWTTRPGCRAVVLLGGLLVLALVALVQVISRTPTSTTATSNSIAIPTIAPPAGRVLLEDSGASTDRRTGSRSGEPFEPTLDTYQTEHFIAPPTWRLAYTYHCSENAGTFPNFAVEVESLRTPGPQPSSFQSERLSVDGSRVVTIHGGGEVWLRVDTICHWRVRAEET